MKQSEITEQAIQTYLNYLLSIRLCYGFDTYKRKFNAAMKEAKEMYNTVVVRKLAVELQKRIDSGYQKAVERLTEQWKTTDQNN